MPVKCKGIEFKAWLESDWGGVDPWWDDVWVVIDGTGTADPIPEEISDTANVTIETGVIYVQNPDAREGVEAVSHFRTWKKNLDTMTLVIQFDKSKHDAVKSALAQIKGVKTV